MKKVVKKVLVALFLLTVLAMFFIAGSMEQDYISLGQGIAASIVNFVLMFFSGFKTGLLDIGGNYDK